MMAAPKFEDTFEIPQFDETEEVVAFEDTSPVEVGFRAPQGFGETLHPDIQRGTDRIVESIKTGSPIEIMRGFKEGFEAYGRPAREGLAGNLIKIVTGDAETELKKQEDTYKRFLIEDLTSQLEEMEQAGEEGTADHQIISSEFQRIYNTPAKELYKSETPEFSVKALVDAVKADPGAFGAELVNAIAEDPEIALTPLGAKTAVAKTAARVRNLGKGSRVALETAAGTAGAAATGAAIIAPISAAEQKVETGEVDLAQVGKETLAGAVITAPLGFAIGLRAGIKQLSRAHGVPEDELIAVAREQVEAGRTLDEALEHVSQTIEEIRGPKEMIKPDTRLTEVKLPKLVRSRVEKALKLGDDELIRAADDIMFFKNQAGKAKVGALVGTGAVATGAAIGYGLEGKIEDALAGAVIGLTGVAGARLLTRIGKGAFTVTKNLARKDNRIRISNIADEAEGFIAAGQRATTQVKQAIKAVVPKAERREAISHWLEGDTGIKLSTEELMTAKKVKKFFEEYGKIGQQEKVLEGLLEDYVPHFWRQGTKSKSAIIDAIQGKGTGGGRSVKTMHSKQRTIPTLREGIEAGLVPATLDIAEMTKMYGDALNRAIANKKMIAALRNEISPDGDALILAADKAPSSYKSIDHKQLAGVKVHPDIEPSMRFLFDATDPSSVMRGILAVNFAAKRGLVSMSFFHANALVESMLFAGIIPRLKLLRRTGKIKEPSLTATERATLSPKEQDMVLTARRTKNIPLKLLMEGKAGDTIDIALKGGLKVGTIEDVGTDVFYATLKDVQTVADNLVPRFGGIPVKVYEKANRVVDNVMWDRIATGGKLAVFSKEFEKEIIRNAKRHKRNPNKYPLETPENIAADIAEYTNDAFGGLNWRRIAESIQNHWGRNIALEALSPTGRKVMQIAMFAPDWTIANVRILAKAFPGVARNKRIARLHQKYLLRGSIFFATVGDGINYMMSGHHLWENEDPTYVDMGDGRKMTFSKQFVEPYHWVTAPGKTGINKMGILPKWGLEQMLGVEYLSSKGAPKMEGVGERLAHTGKKFVPIFIQQIADQGPSGLAGFLGHPIYGKKEDE